MKINTCYPKPIL